MHTQYKTMQNTTNIYINIHTIKTNQTTNQHYTKHYNTIQHNTTQYKTIQHNTTQYNTSQNNATQYKTSENENINQYNTM